MGPFLQYIEPSVITRTLSDQTVVTLTGEIRTPLFIGVADENLPLTDYEILRGSSSTSDNIKTDEDVSQQFTGLNRDFTVQLRPIVKGDGTGTISFDPSTLKVTINGQPAGVAQVFGDTGKVVLSSIPLSTDEVKITYYFKRTDTKKDNENLSVQANSVNKNFKVDFVPIVDGSNGGIPTTNVNKVLVLVNNAIAPVAAVDGQSGVITLVTAPLAGATVLVSYWTNSWQNTFDYLPVTGVVNVNRVGTAPGRADFTNTLDFIIDGNTINWGNAVLVSAGMIAPTSTPFDGSLINTYLYDNKVFMRPASGLTDGTNKVFTLEYVPTEGTGKGITTDDVNKIQVFVGNNISDALLNPPVAVAFLVGTDRKVTLKLAPASGKKVYVTYYHNMMSDDVFTFTNTLASTPLVEGTYTISSANNGLVLDVIEDKPSHFVVDSDFATEGITWPAGGIDAQTIPGYSVEENVLVNFINPTDYLVLSSLGVDGSNGSGSLGQTYVDAKTGLRFTIMPGITVNYQAGDLLEFDIQTPFSTSVLPKYVIPGVKTFVQSSLGVTVNNTGIVKTYNKSGVEPNVGDFYYVTLKYAKTEYPIKVYTKIKNVVNEIGDINTDNKLSLAAYLAFTNGAVSVALAQVTRDESGVDAASPSYYEVLTAVESPIKNYGVKPSLVVPITTKVEVINATRIHCEKMSNERYKGERTSVYGHAVGTTPEQAQSFARSMASERMVGLYPDGAVIGLLDQFGNVNEAIVDGSLLSAAFAGLTVNPIYDVATPLTNKNLSGFLRLIRQVDSVTMNQTATAGVTVLEDQTPNILIRHAMTTNQSSILSREPTVVYIKDYVQQQMRSALKPYIGIKFLPTILQDIESTVDNVLGQLVVAQIITKFQGTSAVQDPFDPTICNVETYYSPVFPLNWISVTFSLRVKL